MMCRRPQLEDCARPAVAPLAGEKRLRNGCSVPVLAQHQSTRDWCPVIFRWILPISPSTRPQCRNGHRLGSDRGSPEVGRTVFSKRVPYPRLRGRPHHRVRGMLSAGPRADRLCSPARPNIASASGQSAEPARLRQRIADGYFACLQQNGRYIIDTQTIEASPG